MPTLIGSSERGAVRNLNLRASGDGTVLMRVEHPNGRSGASITLDQAALRGAVRDGRGVELPTRNNRQGGPVFVERRGDRYYIWIQNVGQNGWSIYVSADELTRVVDQECGVDVGNPVPFILSLGRDPAPFLGRR